MGEGFTQNDIPVLPEYRLRHDHPLSMPPWALGM